MTPNFPLDRTWAVQSLQVWPANVGIMSSVGVNQSETVCGVLLDGIPAGQHDTYPPRMEEIGLVFEVDSLALLVTRIFAFGHWLSYDKENSEEFRDAFWAEVYAHPVPAEAMMWLLAGQPHPDIMAPAAPEWPQEAPAAPAEDGATPEPVAEPQGPVQGPCLCGAIAFVSQGPVRHFPGCHHHRADVPDTPSEPAGPTLGPQFEAFQAQQAQQAIDRDITTADYIEAVTDRAAELLQDDQGGQE